MVEHAMRRTLELLNEGPSDPSGSRYAIAWSDGYRDVLRRTAAGEIVPRVPPDRPLATVLLMCAEGRFAEAERAILDLLPDNLWACERDNEIFTSFVNALFTVQRFDMVCAMLCDRHGWWGALELCVERQGPGPDCVRWNILGLANHRFCLDAMAFDSDNTRLSILLFQWVFPLCAHYARQPSQERGSVIVNLGDIGTVPGLAFCDNRPDRFLVPDSVFLPTKGHALARETYAANDVPWGERLPVAFWRGTTTGVPQVPGDWRTLERIKLCQIAQQQGGRAGLIDAGISEVVQIFDPAASQEIEQAGLKRGPVPWQEWNRYKYQIDVDGNTNSWSGLFYRLLSGSPVLKVESRRGMVQWFYDRLVPWDNYVPIAADLSDLVDKVDWLVRYDSVAERIGRRGRELATAMSYDAEIARAMSVISRAFRYFGGQFDGIGPYGRPMDNRPPAIGS